jgi:chromosome partitioning protein
MVLTLKKFFNKIVLSNQGENADIEKVELYGIDGYIVKALKTPSEVVEEVKTHFQELVFDTIIQRNTRISEAPSYGVSVIMHDANCNGAINYLNLAREIIRKNGLESKEDALKQALL